MKIRVEKQENKKVVLNEDELGFGKIFTDHMFIMNYTEGKGWHDPRVEPYHEISLEPSAMVFHYGQEMFEGLKAYRGADGDTDRLRRRRSGSDNAGGIIGGGKNGSGADHGG